MAKRPPSKPRALTLTNPDAPQEHDRLAAALRANLVRRKTQQRRQAKAAKQVSAPLSDRTREP
jgi:hypothetical protein